MKLIDILVEELPKRGGWPYDVKCMVQSVIDGEIYAYSRNYCDRVVMKKYIGTYMLTKSDDTHLSQHDLLLRPVITREQYEAALASKNDGWIERGGGKRPVSDGTLVDVKYRSGEINQHVKAGVPDNGGSIDTASAVRWNKIGAGCDIIAYRLHQPQEAEQPESSEEDLNECIGQDVAPAWNGDGKPTMGTKCEHHSGGQWEVVTIAGIYENLMTGFTDYWMVKEDGSSYTVGNPYRFRPIRSEADKRRDEAVQALCDAGGGNGKVDDKAGYGSCWFDVYDAIAAGKIPGVKLEG